VFEGNFDYSTLLPLLPEILLVVLALFILTIDLFLSEEKRENLGWVTAGGLGLILGLSLAVARPELEPRMIFGGMLRSVSFLRCYSSSAPA